MSDEQMKNRPASKLSRREALRLVGAAAATSAVLTSASCAGNKSNDVKQSASKAAASGSSVFEDPCACHNSEKYGKYDPTTVYPVVAFWLMLTTDNWDTCISPGFPVPEDCPDAKPKKTEAEAKQWREKLANELGMAPEYLEYLYDKYKNNPTLHSAFLSVRGAFQTFIENPPPVNDRKQAVVYGGHPCLGGRTLLQIAALKGA